MLVSRFNLLQSFNYTPYLFYKKQLKSEINSFCMWALCNHLHIVFNMYFMPSVTRIGESTCICICIAGLIVEFLPWEYRDIRGEIQMIPERAYKSSASKN